MKASRNIKIQSNHIDLIYLWLALVSYKRDIYCRLRASLFIIIVIIYIGEKGIKEVDREDPGETLVNLMYPWFLWWKGNLKPKKKNGL